MAVWSTANQKQAFWRFRRERISQNGSVNIFHLYWLKVGQSSRNPLVHWGLNQALPRYPRLVGQIIKNHQTGSWYPWVALKDDTRTTDSGRRQSSRLRYFILSQSFLNLFIKFYSCDGLNPTLAINSKLQMRTSKHVVSESMASMHICTTFNTLLWGLHTKQRIYSW